MCSLVLTIHIKFTNYACLNVQNFADLQGVKTTIYTVGEASPLRAQLNLFCSSQMLSQGTFLHEPN